jgi:hypothetical protein
MNFFFYVRVKFVFFYFLKMPYVSQYLMNRQLHLYSVIYVVDTVRKLPFINYDPNVLHFDVQQCLKVEVS